jgi:hypothetical protein
MTLGSLVGLKDGAAFLLKDTFLTWLIGVGTRSGMVRV